MSEDYAGFVTRAIAFAIDVALVDLAAVIVAIVVGLGISALDVPDVIVTITIAIGGVAYLVWFVGYFAMFWSTTGQTPGARVMGVRVVCANGGEPVRLRAAVVRLAGMVLAAIPLFAGLPADPRRRPPAGAAGPARPHRRGLRPRHAPAQLTGRTRAKCGACLLGGGRATPQTRGDRTRQRSSRCAGGWRGRGSP